MRKLTLKRKARKYYRAYHKALDSFDCEGNLAEYIKPELKELRDKFNSTLDELAKIDSDCPAKRL